MEQLTHPLVADSYGLICGFELAPLAVIEHEELGLVKPGRPVWLHFNWADGRARDWLKELGHLHPDAVDTLLEVEPHVHVQVLPHGFVAVLRDLHHELGGGEAEFGTLGVYVDATRMISGRRHPLRTVDHLRHQLVKGLEIPSPLALFEYLVESLAETFEAIVTKIAATVEDAEDTILAGHFKDQGAELRRARWLLARLRRHASANRSALERLPGHLPPSCGLERRQSLVEAIERLAAVAQDLELVEDRARLMQEEIAGRLGETTNRNLYWLSIVTTALLPITLITGIFGMNVGGLPWMEAHDGFTHVMLLMVCGVMVALAFIGRARAQ
jgi:zinc transporter